MIWNETKECMSRDEMTNLQSARLVKLVDYVYHNVEFYRKKMQAVGLMPGDIKNIEDITKLPFTTKDDLRDNYPFGLFAVPNSEIVRIHASPKYMRFASWFFLICSAIGIVVSVPNYIRYFPNGFSPLVSCVMGVWLGILADVAKHTEGK